MKTRSVNSCIIVRLYDPIDNSQELSVKFWWGSKKIPIVEKTINPNWE